MTSVAHGDLHNIDDAREGHSCGHSDSDTALSMQIHVYDRVDVVVLGIDPFRIEAARTVLPGTCFALRASHRGPCGT